MAKRKIICTGDIKAVASEQLKKYDSVASEKTDEEFEDLLATNTIETIDEPTDDLHDDSNDSEKDNDKELAEKIEEDEEEDQGTF